MSDEATTDQDLHLLQRLFPDLARTRIQRAYECCEQDFASTKRVLFEEDAMAEASSPEPECRRSSRAGFSGRNADGLRGVLLPSGSLIRLHSGELQDMQEAYEAQEVVLNGLASTVAAVGSTVSASIIKGIDNLSSWAVEMSQHLGGHPEHERGAAWAEDQIREFHTAQAAHGACTVTVASSIDAQRRAAQGSSPLKQRNLQNSKPSNSGAGFGDAAYTAAAAASGKAVRGKAADNNAISMFDAEDWYMAGHDPQENQPTTVRYIKDD